MGLEVGRELLWVQHDAYSSRGYYIDVYGIWMEIRQEMYSTAALIQVSFPRYYYCTRFKAIT